MQATTQLSVRIPVELHREAKEKAARDGRSLQDLVESALRRVLASDPTPTVSPAAEAALRRWLREDYAEEIRRLGEEDPDLASM